MKTIAAIALACLTACGGGSYTNAEQPLLATGTSTTQAGDQRTGAAVLVLPLVGPTITMDRPATVRIQLQGAVQHSTHYPAATTATVGITAPVPTGTNTEPAQGNASLDYGVTVALPAGDTALMAQLTLRASTAQGLPTAALSRATAEVHWTITRE